MLPELPSIAFAYSEADLEAVRDGSSLPGPPLTYEAPDRHGGKRNANPNVGAHVLVTCSRIDSGCDSSSPS